MKDLWVERHRNKEVTLGKKVGRLMQGYFLLEDCRGVTGRLPIVLKRQFLIGWFKIPFMEELKF